MDPDTGFADRDRILAYISKQIIGPLEGDDEVLDEKPQHQYLTAILYPISPGPGTPVSGRSDDDDEILDEIPGQVADDDDDDPITLSGQMRPSSVGLSFMATDWSDIEVEIEAGLYRPAEPGSWQREPVKLACTVPVRAGAAGPGSCDSRVDLLDGVASVDVRWRPYGSGVIVTVVLVNRRPQKEPWSAAAEECLFQVGLRCWPSTGSIARYPTQPHLYADQEAEELELLYRAVPVYAIGHGAAAAWDRGSDSVIHAHTSFFPVHVVPDVEFEIPGRADTLDLWRLARIETDVPAVIAELDDFVDNYRSWIEGITATVSSQVAPRLAGAADRLIGRMATAERRMRRGVRLLADDHRVRQAFGMANLAMLMQMVHSAPDLAGTPHRPSQAPHDVRPDYPRSQHFWRPFQLGFLLLTMEGTVTTGADRDLVDLIWFPTGGGKTEAYLALAAFTILHRRLTHGDDGAGTTVITRYTLRLLTAQQFQRAATMIAACEILRSDRPDELGSRPVSIGIWVGGDNSPNTYAEARRLRERIEEGRILDQGFQVESCPWCGTKFVPSQPRDEKVWGIDATNNSFRAYCVNPRCPFAAGIPISSVDEDLYDNPPTMLVGTVDKFARTVWEHRTGVFFGAGPDPGPALIIQDEFHLISGPLGTIVGIYEAAFDVLMTRNGARPKIVAATATIRRADQQTLGVFGREVALFPPAGIDADDSYFVRMVSDRPGRAYAGVMPQGHTPLTALIHLAAAQLQAPVDVELSPDAADAYWTFVAYHNSLRELGKTITLAHDDIPARLKIIARAEDDCRQLEDDEIVELTSNVPAVTIPRILDRLGRPRTAAGAVSFLASTNMISVGVDVRRLGTMTVVGQPKTTAEYIQATSRVGRSLERPGIVVTLYSPSKPRDRSHYESFVPYHSMLYSSVEPTSVTPFSLPARVRALHAGLVILVRHALGLSANEDAARFDAGDPDFRAVMEEYLDRARVADSSEAANVATHMSRLIADWSLQVVDAEAVGGLHYRYAGKDQARLLKRFTERGEGWPTLDSMRSVDVEVTVGVRGVRG
jgi:hypothetical protein